MKNLRTIHVLANDKAGLPGRFNGDCGGDSDVLVETVDPIERDN